MSVQPLTEEKIATLIGDLPGWTVKENKLHWEHKFQDVGQAFAFLTRVALYSETADHHAEIFNVYNNVRLDLTTHDAGNKISEKDTEFARFVSQVMQS